MNRRMVLNILGRMLKVEAVLLLMPALVSAVYRESSIWPFLMTASFSFIIGILLQLLSKPRKTIIYAKEGFIIVALVWISISLIGCLPFVISGEIPNFIDAFFETVSGFTTTGASVLKDVEILSHGMLFWRSFTHWVGGMGILVFVMAIIPNLSDRTIHIMRAEMPGPVVDKIVPRVKQTAKILYLIYLVITLTEIVLLLAGGMPLFDSVVHSFGTAGTGGFGIKRDSISSYSPYCQWVIAVFMMLFGVNFNIYYLILVKKFKNILKSTELWSYISIMLAGTAIITVNNIDIYRKISVSVRHSFFQVSSIMTTTGYSTADFDRWHGLSKTVLFILMFIGACAGSTGGGLKVSRLVLLLKATVNEIKRLLHPRSVSSIRFEGKQADETTINSVNRYFVAYILCFVVAFLLISFENFGLETNISATAACFNNIGPGFGGVGPALNYGLYSGFSKMVLSVSMLLGRLEIFPILIFFLPAAWKRN